MFSRKTRVGFLGAVIAAAALGGVGTAAHAGTTYYIATVAGGGNDNNSGTSSTLPLKTFKQALLKVGSDVGDTIQVAAGTYEEGISVQYKNSLTLKGIGSPKLTATAAHSGNFAIITIQGSSNITVTGFVIDGGKGNNGLPDAGNDCSGILFGPAYGATGPITPSYHINVTYNTVQNMGGTGIATGCTGTDRIPNFSYGCDYVSITRNTISNTNSTGRYNSSGISCWQCVNSDGGSGFHNIIQNNTVCNSLNVNPDSSKHSDGNGIIIDSGGQTTPPTVIQNNVVYNNSGRGIYVLNASNVSILNNTCYQNCRDTILDGTHSRSIGEIVVFGQGNYPNPPSNINIKVYNNATVTRGVVNGLTIANYVVLRQDYSQNIYSVDDTIVVSSKNSWYNGQNNLFGMTSTPTLLNLFPLFTNAAGGDFSEKSGSPTINAGTNTVKATTDILWNPRPYNGGITDLGAYESQLY